MDHGRDPDVDIDRFDRRLVEVARVVLLAQSAYHRLDVRHLDRLPAGPAILAGNHNGGFNPVDALFLTRYYERADVVPVHPLAHEVFFRARPLGDLMSSLGVLPACPTHGARALERGHKVLVFPGSDLDSMRPFHDRARVRLGGHKGFARLAVRTGVPVIPLVTEGAHAGFVVLTQGEGLARALGLDRLLHWHSMPITVAFPWGLMIGPAAYFPYVPAPVRVVAEIGEPIDPASFTGTLEARVEAVYEATEHALQTRLTALHHEASTRKHQEALK